MLYALVKTFFSVPSSMRDNELNSISRYDDECVCIKKDIKKPKKGRKEEKQSRGNKKRVENPMRIRAVFVCGILFFIHVFLSLVEAHNAVYNF